MGLDPYFKKWERRRRKGEEIRANSKYRWPEGSQFGSQKRLEMKQVGIGAWYHVMQVPESCALEEVRRWKENNPGWEFRLPEGPFEDGVVLSKKMKKTVTGKPIRRKWDQETWREREARLERIERNRKI